MVGYSHLTDRTRLVETTLSLIVCCAISQAASAINVESLIQKSVVANEADWNAAPKYSHIERDHTGATTKTYKVTMVLGTPYHRLIELNNRPLSPEENAKEQQKFEQILAQRKRESADERAKRIAKYERDRKRDHLMMEQLTQAFEFKLLGQRTLSSYQVYVLRATPRPGYKPPNMETQVLPGMRGELWIDQKTFQWVKVTAQVVRPVSIEGFLARVEPGTRFELEKMPVDDHIWLVKHFSMRSSAKVLYMFNRSDQEDDTFSDYRKITDSSDSTLAPRATAKSK